MNLDEIVKKIATEINEHIDIPFLSESQEQILFETVIRLILTLFPKKTLT
jgi:hypothetical protein